MRGRSTTFFGTAVAFACASAVMGLALAQVAPTPATPGDPLKAIPEKMLPPSEGIPAPSTPATPAAPGTAPATPAAPANAPAKESLTERLDRTDGVLKPPANVAPPMNVPAPAPRIDPEMVLPPPAAPQPAPPK